VRVTDRVNADHRATLERIFRHPAGGNIEWRQVLSLLEAVGTVTEEHNGNVKVTIGPETEVLRPPREKDVDKQMIVDLRRMLENAGLAP
jgi:type II secretory pathway component HofQ